MQIRTLMTSEPASCDADTPIWEAARTMIERDCGALPVVENGNGIARLVGIVTDRDITTRLVAARNHCDSVKVGEIMSHPIVSVLDSASVEECLRVMAENQLRRVPVVDQAGGLVGIVAQADFATKGLQGAAGELVKQVSQSFGPGPG